MLSYGQSMFSATLPGCVSWLRCLRGSSARPLDPSPGPILFGGSVKGARVKTQRGEEGDSRADTPMIQAVLARAADRMR